MRMPVVDQLSQIDSGKRLATVSKRMSIALLIVAQDQLSFG